ncbi:MAG: asparagine synthase C-terminal domain-containing protein [Haloarculaceae archaeon]
MRGADPAVVERALGDGDPLPGTGGFAGALADGRLARDVLGRRPLFSERGDATTWGFDPDELADPVPVPAGHVRTPDGDREVWRLPDLDPERDDRAAVDRLRSAVRESVDAVDESGLAVAFSGGVDSAALAARLDTPCYVVGFPDSHDVAAAREAARVLDVDLRVVELSLSDVETAVPAVANAIRTTDAMNVQIALGLFLAARAAAADGFDRLALGQGADELFGGYAKVASAPDDSRVEADTVRGARREVVATLPEQLQRDTLAVRATGVDPVTPLLHDRVVAAALALPGRLLVTDRGERKWAFRRAVRAWVPDRVAFREKKAVQYGSLVARELDRLARQAGFKRRIDDHVGQYVAARVE